MGDRNGPEHAGWDAHAAYKCTGLSSHAPDSRKAEFKRKYLQNLD